MQTKTILRVAYVVAGLALAMWVAIGGVVWYTWEHHRQDVAEAASSLATTSPLGNDPAEVDYEPFDRSRSSVQYERLEKDAASEDVPTWLSRRIGPLSASEQTMAAWVLELREQGVQVCFEQVRRDWQTPDPPFAISRGAASVREVLDELCAKDERYYWEWMKGSEVVNVLVRGRSEARLGNVAFRNRPLEKCQAEIEPYLLATLYGPNQSRNEMFVWPMDISAREITVRDYLNLLVKQYEGMTWTVNYMGQVAFDAPEATREEMRQQLNIRPPNAEKP
jgi:hypothetical protein